MQAQGFIQKVMSSEANDKDDRQSQNKEVSEFWQESNSLAQQQGMDQNLAWMLKMKEHSDGKELFTKNKLKEYGSRVDLFPGVEEWFGRINSYGKKKGVIIEHYIISSGLKEMIEGTPIANEFTEIYASSFYYDSSNVAVWPAQVVNFTNKTQFLFRIEKGVTDVNDPAVNDHTPAVKIRVPFRNMVYIGDSDTDVPCMRLVNSYGGHSIGVYKAISASLSSTETSDEELSKSKVYKMMRDERIRYFAKADYSENGDLDCLVKAIIDRTQSNEILERRYLKDQSEAQEYFNRTDDNHEARQDIIHSLAESPNFSTTHTLIAAAKPQSEQQWSKWEVLQLLNVAQSNSQVKWIITDTDVREFFETIIMHLPTVYQRKVRKEFETLIAAVQASSPIKS